MLQLLQLQELRRLCSGLTRCRGGHDCFLAALVALAGSLLSFTTGQTPLLPIVVFRIAWPAPPPFAISGS
jgi:hypothetical protein